MCLAFGFLGGNEVKEAGIANAGLYDRESCNSLTWPSIILLIHQNDSPSIGYKSTSLSLEVILGGSQCEIQRRLLIYFGTLTQHLTWQLGRKRGRHIGWASATFR